MNKKFIGRVVVIFILCFFGLSGWHNNVHARTGVVQLDGNTLLDDNGTFTGLGASYFYAFGDYLDYIISDDKANHPFEKNIEFLSAQGFNYIRVLSMVNWTDFNKTVDPNAIDNYTQKLGAMIDDVYSLSGQNMRTQITIFASTEALMPKENDPEREKRWEHINRILNVVNGREQKVILLEVANEYAGNDLTRVELKEYGEDIGSKTNILLALSSEGWVSTPKDDVFEIHNGVNGVDIATIHFMRYNPTSNPTPDTMWKPVFDCEDVYSLEECLKNLPNIKASSNEPIGLRLGDDHDDDGEFPCNEKDPMRLVMAAVYAWHSKLPMYVFHSTPGIINPQNKTFQEFFSLCEDTFSNNYSNIFKNAKDFLPPNLPNWQKLSCTEANAPFECVAGITRCSSSINGDDFYAFPITVVAGAQIKAQRTIYSLEVYDPLDLYDSGGNPKPLAGFPASLNLGDTLTFPSPSKEAYIFKGKVDDKYINVLQPNGGEQWENGETYSIQWESSGDIGNVSIHLYKNNIYQQTIAEDLGNTGTYSWNIPGATTPGSDYQISVKSSLYEYLEDFSDTFFTIGSLPSAPALVWPVNIVNIQTRQPEFDWADVTAFPVVTNYEIKILDTTQTIILHTATTGNQSHYQIPYEMDCNTLYYWKVRAHNDTGWGSWSDAVFFETPEVPVPPEIISPTNSQFVNTLTPVLNWYPANSVIPVTDYQIQVFDDGGFTIYGPISVGDVTSFQIPAGLLSLNETYSWRVRAYNACSWSDWSSKAYFKTPQTPYAPTIIYPKGGVVTPRTVTLRWNPVNVNPPVDQYHVQVFRVSDNSLLREKWPTGTSTTVTLPGNTTYKWHVRAHNSKGWGPWSDYMRFKTN